MYVKEGIKTKRTIRADRKSQTKVRSGSKALQGSYYEFKEERVSEWGAELVAMRVVERGAK